jgi:hypothetical protein
MADKKISISMFEKLSILFLTVVICSSCGCTAPKFIKDNFTYCFDGIDTGIDSLINVEGYYVIFDIERDSRLHLMFYKDGTYIEGFSSSYYKSIQSLFEEMMNDPNKLKGFHKYREWGRYIICSDTIKVQTVERPGAGSMSRIWWFSEVWFKIIDRNTIVGIYPTKSLVRYPEGIEVKNYMRNYGIPARFYPLSVKPNSDCFLKKEDWFWCNEELYRQYKQTLKPR